MFGQKVFHREKKTQESEESEEELEAKKVRGIAKAFHEFLQLDSHGPLHQEGCKVDVWNFDDINILKYPPHPKLTWLAMENLRLKMHFPIEHEDFPASPC